MPPQPKKLIEIDLPLDVINRESAREKSIRHGHPSTLHLWWARRPLAACRAVIFASMVDDPSSLPDEFPSEDEQRAERRRLHGIIERLVKWEATDESRTGSPELLDEARYEIARSVARSREENPPAKDAPNAVLRYLGEAALPIYDPFAGGGSIPLEAQRLGLRAIASDLNPVAVLINKALIEIPPKFAAKPAVNPDADPMGMKTGKMIGRGKNRRPEVVAWSGAAGLADDVRYYGRRMREMAFERIGHLYPKAKLPNGGEATVIAWLWARTVPCPNPACRADMPLMTTFQLSKKSGNRHWMKPVVNRDANETSVSFEVQDHDGGVPNGGTVRGGAQCVACDSSVPRSYLRERARAGEMRQQMTAIVAEGDRKRIFLSPTDEHARAAETAEPRWRPSGRLPNRTRDFTPTGYGFMEWHQLFSKRQLTAITTLSDLMPEIRALIVEHGASSAYANAVCAYLAIAIGKTTNACSIFSRWQNSGDKVAGVFSRQAIQFMWDFAESNPFCNATQNYMAQIEWVAKVVERLPPSVNMGECHQADATTTIYAGNGPVIVTDPPYYDNVGFADLSDFFYVWLRPLLRDTYPDLFSGILTPKSEEMVAEPSRFENSRERFEKMMRDTLRLVRERATSNFPSSIFYAYKQQEEVRDGITSTGWDTMLTALVNAGFRIVGAWPMRTERSARPRSLESNALASSVVLVCRPRDADAPIATRRQFIDALGENLPAALDHLTREGHIAPVDLAQAAIGPGMEIYSRYSRVETIAGEPVPVREALIEINRAVAFYHRREQGDLDPESRFCMDWLRSAGFAEASYGDAELLSQALNVSVESMDALGLLDADAGRVRLLPMESYNPEDRPLPPGGRVTAWEAALRMAYHMGTEYGEGITGCARVVLAMGGGGGSAERLARILYDYHDSKGDSAAAVIFNNIAVSWQAIQTEARRLSEEETQAPLV